MKVAEDHFDHQFDRYPEGEPRLRAATRHAAHLLNSLEQVRIEELRFLRRLRHRLIRNASPVEAALMIQERIDNMEVK